LLPSVSCPASTTLSLAVDLAHIDLVCACIPEPETDATHIDVILARFDEVDRKLVAAGFPATSPWWRETIERWYRSGKRQACLRCGRRAGKSSTLTRLAVVEALYGKHDVPPGDVGFVAIISTDRPEALGRLRTVQAILDALGVSYRPCKGGVVGIELAGRRTGFRVFTASIKGVSGFTAIFVLCDEVAKWADVDTGANPATEVISSVRPTMQTQPNARMVLSSSPMSMLDAHYDAFEQGETDLQVIAHAPSWIANPTITEASTRRDEPDETKWLREYAAIPSAEAETSLLTEAICERARRVLPMHWHLPYIEGYRYVAAMDPATRGHAWTLVVATKGPDGKRRVAYAKEWRGTPSRPLSPKAVLLEVRDIVAVYGLRWVTTDQHAIDQMRDLCPTGLSLHEAPWTQQNIKEATEHVRNLLQSDQLELHPDPMVKADLLGIRKQFTRAGARTYFAEVKGRHSDYAPAVCLAVEDARFAASVPDPALDDDGEAQAAKHRYLEGRRKERLRAEKFGRVPATHRKRVA
jgi:hypothetical protein